jgi:phytoene dehydrogenase-like protein
MADVVIIGAGTSGLFSAAMLARNGYRVEVYEKAKEIGGRARSWRKDGYMVDYGCHLIRNGPKGYIPTTLAELGEQLDIILLKEPEILWWEGQRFYELPRDPAKLIERGILDESDLSIIYQLLQEKETAIEQNMGRSIQEWLQEIKAGPRLEKFLRMVAMGIVCPFLERASAGELFDYIFRGMALGGLPSGYPVGGFGVVHEKLIKIITSFGGRITTGEKVQKVTVTNGRVSGLRVGSREIKADRVICAFPCQELFRILDGNLVEAKTREMLMSLTPTSGISIDYGLKERITEVSGPILLPGNPFIFGLVTSNIDFSVAPPGRQLMTFTALTSPEEAKDKLKAKAILAHLEGKISEMFPGKDRSIEWRRPLFLPIIDGVELNFSQYRARRPEPEVPGIEGLFLAGDYLGVEGAGGDLAVTSARLCAERIEEKYG